MWQPVKSKFTWLEVSSEGLGPRDRVPSCLALYASNWYSLITPTQPEAPSVRKTPSHSHTAIGGSPSPIIGRKFVCQEASGDLWTEPCLALLGCLF